MSARNSEIASRVAATLQEIRAVVRDALVGSEASGFCCGVRFERTRPENEMQTPSSCCGVRI